MDIIAWVVLGALAGWIASVITGTNAEQGAIGNIVVGIIGAFIGGLLLRLFGTGNSDLGTFNLSSLLTAIVGATALLWAVKGFRRGRSGI